jgi:hypothetical protein
MLAASAQFALNLVREFEKTAAKQFRYAAQGDRRAVGATQAVIADRFTAETKKKRKTR